MAELNIGNYLQGGKSMAEVSKEKLLEVYERMKLIRTFEDRSAELFAEGKLVKRLLP